MIRILGISGSLRARSFNTAVLRSATPLVGPDVEFDVATLHGIPLYDADLERREGLPPAVAALKDRIVGSHGVILATPEYNNGVPGVFKNAIDWLSRPPDDIPRVFHRRAFALIGASPGGFGTILAQNAWLPILRTLGVSLWVGGRLLVSRAHSSISEDGTVTDDAVRNQLGKFIAGFAAHVGQVR